MNREQIAESQALIEDMRKQVKTWQVVETAAAISAGVAFFAGAVIAISPLVSGSHSALSALLQGLRQWWLQRSRSRRCAARLTPPHRK
ncbi:MULTISPECIES: hypothetical protein [unclassified Pseudomonas]|uniref:Uncharacterized protein n=1 Tax=Pseudomonas sp. 13.2 TaxID=3144665 RepID=A0AAU7BHE5_9PSED|nr:hypothetical protein [Pseudomonas sp. SWI36]